MNDWGPFSVAGRRTIVTGGAAGIGFGIAKRFLEGGARVLLVDRDEEAVHAAAGRLSAPPRQLQVLALDVTAPGAPVAIVDRCVQAFGGLDVLVNNAGIYPLAPAMKMTPELFDQVIGVNLRAPVFLCQAAALRMVEQGHAAAIINIASIDSLHPSMVGMAAYDASKGALLSFTRSLALELAPRRIRVNAIAPGAIATEGTARPLQAGGMDREHFLSRIPLGRMGFPDEIATAAVFLASSASDYMTGSLLVADGGTLLA